MAAVNTALMGQVRAGDHVVASKQLFGSCRYIVEDHLPRYGVTSTLVDGTDLDEWKKAVTKNTKTFFLESPTNPNLEVLDIAAIAKIAHDAGATLVVDNVFSTPLFQQPARARRRLRRLFGDQAHRRPGPLPRRRDPRAPKNSSWTMCTQLIRQTGPSLSPFNAWVLLKGLETLVVRVHKQTDNAAAVAVALAEHPKVTRLIYPGRPDHPQAEIIRRQMKGGSNLVAFEVKGGKAGAFRFQDALKLVKISNNLGDAKSLITHPATTTHQRLTPEARAELGITDGMVRLVLRARAPRRSGRGSDGRAEDRLTAISSLAPRLGRRRPKPPGGSRPRRSPGRARARRSRS